MKRNLHIFLVLAFACLSTTLLAQLPNGSVAPDWTLTDLNGDTYNLYDELDAGKSIILDISATWCPPCWTYHTSGVMESLYEDYGPDGTDQIRVFMVEGDDITNLACLYGPTGCNNSTMGDWVTGTHYPIFSPEPAAADAFISDYQLGFWPTIYGISPLDKTTQLIGQASYSEWEGWLIDSWQMSASATTIDSDCPHSGVADLEVNLGFGDLEYEWSDGSTDEDLVDVPAGTYSVTVTDAHNVDIIVDNIVVGGTSSPALAVAYLGSEDVDCSGNSSGSLDVMASGGSGSFMYTWDNGMVGSYIENLPVGDYIVTATDASGCDVIEMYTIGEPDELTMGTSVTSTACGEENGFAYVFGDGGTTPYLYDIGFGSQFSGSFPSLAPGDYVAKITDNNGCITEEPITVAESVAPVAMAEVSEAINCNNVEVEVTAANSTSTGNVNYQWTTTDGEIVGDNEEETIMASAAGTYSVQLTETSTGCISMAEVVVEDNSSVPNVALADTDMISCTVSQVVIDGSMSDTGANLTYTWTTADGNILGDTDGFTVDVDQGGTYTLSVNNEDNGCVSSESITVEADIDIPMIAVTSEVLTCAVSEVEICATIDAGHTVSWTTDAGEVTQTCITVAAAGDYTATVVAPNGCESSAISSVTASTDLPVVSVAAPSVLTCTEESVQIEANIEGDATDNIISWTDADGNVIAEGSEAIMVTEPGVYEVSVTNSLGCTTSTSVSVDQDINSPVAGFDYSVDNDGVVVLNSTSAEGGSVTWTLADGTVLNGDEATFSLSEGGEYEVCMTYNNECGSDEDCQTVVFSTLLAVSIDKSNLTCFESSDGSIVPTVTGGASGYTYYWIGSNGFESTDANLSGLAAGLYTLVISDDEGSEISVEVTISEPEELRSMDESITNVTCNGDSNGGVSLSMIGGTGTYSYLWSDGSTEANRSDLVAGDYTLLVTDENECEFSQLYTVQEPEALSLTSVIATEETDDLLNGSIEIAVVGGTGDLMYEWSNGETTASIDNLAAGEYSVIITDANGCSYSQEGIVVGTLTDVADLDIVTDFKMYPIPAFSYLNLNATMNGTQTVNINILDATGQYVWTRSFTTNVVEEVIDISNFPPGIYTLSMISGKSVQSENFIVIK